MPHPCILLLRATAAQEMTSTGSCPSQPSLPSPSCDPSGVVQLSRSPEVLRQLALSQLQPAAQPRIGLASRNPKPGTVVARAAGTSMTRSYPGQSALCTQTQCTQCTPNTPKAPNHILNLPRPELTELTELPFFEAEAEAVEAVEAEEAEEVEATVQKLQAAVEAFSDGRQQLRQLLTRRKHLEAQFQRAAEGSRASAEAVESAVEDARRWLHIDLPRFLAKAEQVEGPVEGMPEHRDPSQDWLERGDGGDDGDGNTKSAEPLQPLHQTLRHKCTQQAAELQRLTQKCAELQAGEAADLAKLDSLQRQMLKERVSHQDQLDDLRARRAELLRSLGGTAGQIQKNPRHLLQPLGGFADVCRLGTVHSGIYHMQVLVALCLCRTRSPSASSMSMGLKREFVRFRLWRERPAMPRYKLKMTLDELTKADPWDARPSASQ